MDLVQAFARRYGGAGGSRFGGLIPAYFNYGPFEAYFAGQGYCAGETSGEIYVLGCECGEVGCDPFTTVVTLGDDTVTWDAFANGAGAGYAALGPFIFEREQYEEAVRDMIAELATRNAS